MDDDRLRPTKIRRMLEAIAADYAFAGRLIGLSAPSSRVLAALAEVPREEFVPVEMRPFAYDNRALPIENGQTISQPFIVALMTDLLQPREGDRMLEIGTGSGYQAAVLSRLVEKVYSVEIIPDLARQAVQRFERLGYVNIEVREGDGHAGWPAFAPYDGIVVTAATAHVPRPLTNQLKPGARLVLPLRRFDFTQELTVVEKKEDNRIEQRDVLGVAFVPLTGGHGRGGETS